MEIIKNQGEDQLEKKIEESTNNECIKIMGTLGCYREKLDSINIKTKNIINEKREKLGYVDLQEYPIEQIKKNINDIVLKLGYNIPESSRIDVKIVDRKVFDADLTIKISKLIGQLKGEYREILLPQLKETLESDPLLSQNIEHIDIKGIYINLKMKDHYLINTISNVETLGKSYGHNNIHKGESTVIDYSSPNTAKSLHAGHIRSTVLGEVLGNIYEANGYAVHRMNHINDRGGFGVYLAGIKLWGDILKKQGLEKNSLMVEIYKIYRLAEKNANNEDDFNELNTKDLELLQSVFGHFDTYTGFLTHFKEFKIYTKKEFTKLENGEEKTAKQRKEIVGWSLKDFENFYNELNIHLDYTVGESFYANKGKEQITCGHQVGDIIYFNQDEVEKAKKELTGKEKTYDKIIEEIENDKDSYIIKLPNFERYVVMKQDGSTIYATRDLGAIKYRIDTFDPSMIVYVVGQEQGDHFKKLFESAKKLGYENNASMESVDLQHTPFGFYLDAETKKKLSSRAGAANVHKLIQGSKEYYKKKYEESDYNTEEINDISEKLAMGGITYNDISKGRMLPVSVNSNLKKTIEEFEKSGGVYISYAVCRAKSLLEKYNEAFDTGYTFDEKDIELNTTEAELIKKINQFNDILNKASNIHEPYIVAQYLFTLAQAFNSFYNSSPILKGGDMAPFRARLTKNTIQVLENACNICHLPVPNRI